MARKNAANALTLLKKDHAQVKGLFDRFEEADDLEVRARAAREAIDALKVHTHVEEELFYPALRRAGADGIIDEADEEHHFAKLAIAELELMDGAEGSYRAKFMVLAELMRHHIKEEERAIFAFARASSVDLDELGRAMDERKRELSSGEIPSDAEEEIIQRAGLIPSVSKQYAQDFRFPGA